LDFLYPRVCAVCGGEPESARNLCWDCGRAVEFQGTGSFCSRCGRNVPAPSGPFVCTQCRENPPAFDLARSAARFQGPVRELAHDLKYRGASHLVPDLVDFLEAAVLRHYADERIDAVCPVPLHPSRQRKRGYNQSALLGAELAARLGIPVFPDALRRVRDTPTQTRLGAAARRRNVADAFAVHPLLPGWFESRRLLLLDDVMTTGATLSECAKALRAAGAERVLALSVARD
jgi:ComF family protein